MKLRSNQKVPFYGSWTIVRNCKLAIFQLTPQLISFRYKFITYWLDDLPKKKLSKGPHLYISSLKSAILERWINNRCCPSLKYRLTLVLQLVFDQDIVFIYMFVNISCKHTHILYIYIWIVEINIYIHLSYLIGKP